MFVERALKYLITANNRSLIKIGAFIVISQILIFLITDGLAVEEFACLSIMPIICFAFVFGELPALFFATIITMCFSPFWIDVGNSGSGWWVLRTFGFASIALVTGIMSKSLRDLIVFKEKIYLTDIFTDLPNRQALCEKLAEMSKSQVSGHFTIVIVTISNSKVLVEIFGNKVLKSIFYQFKDRYADFTKRIFSEMETYSLSSNKVAFFFENKEEGALESKEEFETNLISIAKKNFLHDGFFVHCDSHLGLYRFSDFSEINHGEQPLNYAEEATDTAVKQMKDLVVYNPSNLMQKSKFSKSSDILGDIDLAIRSRWMFLVYQPKINMATGEIHSAEALIRWNHPIKGFVPPGLFIPQAEQSTLIENITDFVIKQAILQLKLWQRSGIDVSIAVNVSTYNLLQPNFVNKVLNLLNENGLTPECLEIEITEGALISDFQNVLDGLKRFRDAKIKIALDDFGTGYSSLQYLQKLPIDYLKIDQSFVRSLETNKQSKEIVKAIVDLAHTIDIKTVAEGIETISDYDYLHHVNCDIGQGFFMSKPLTSNAFVSWYSENNGVFKKSLE
jgi:EAL domain-containing protein (putative c-di-GMP-specific phosphodiesterase class I)